MAIKIKEDKLVPEGWAEEDLTQGAPSLDPLVPKEGNWKDVPLRKEGQYVPEVLKGTKYEAETEDIVKSLLPMKEKGFETAVRLDKGNVAWALNVFKGINPEVAAKVQRISKERQVPFEQVLANTKEWDQWDQAQKVFKSLFEVNAEDQQQMRYPYTAHWIVDPENMALAKDDVDVLTEIEGIVTAYHRPFRTKLKHKLVEASKEGIRAGVSAVEWFNDMTRQEAEEVERLEKIDPLAAYYAQQKSLFGFIPMIQKELGPERTQKIKEWLAGTKETKLLKPIPLPEVGGIEQFVLDAVGIAPQVLGTVAAAGTTAYLGAPVYAPLAGVGFISSYIFGSTYGELRDQDVDPTRAAYAAFGNAAIQGAIEYMPLNMLLGAFKTTGAKQIIAEFFKAAIAEGGAEFLQSFPEQASMIWGLAEKEGQTFEEQVSLFVERLPETAKQGLYEGLLVAPIALMGAGIKLPYDYTKNRNLAEDIKVWDKFLGLSEKSKLRERSPEDFEKYAKGVVENSEVPDNFYVSVDSVKEFFQGDMTKVQEVAKDLGISDEQLNEADALKRDLEIDTAKWASKYAGSELSLAIRNDMRFSVDGMSLREQETLRKESLVELQKMQKEYQDLVDEHKVPDEVYNMRTKIMLPKDEGGLGLSAQDADAQLAVFMSGAKALSKEAGESVEDWFRRVNPVVNIEGVEVTPERPPVKEVVPPEEVAPTEIEEEPTVSYLPEGPGVIVTEEANIPVIEGMKKDIEEARAGRRVPIIDPETGKMQVPEKFIAEPSTFPEYFKDKGYGKKPALTAINKVLAGKELTEKQKEMIEDLYNEKNETEGWGAPPLSLEGQENVYYQSVKLSPAERGAIDQGQREQGGYKYVTNCTESTADLIDEMVGQSQEVSYPVFVKNIGGESQLKELFPGVYAWGREKGLKLKDDYAVSYYRSEYEGRPAYYMQHSAIEYVFVGDDFLEEANMVTVHNLTAENIIYSDKLGALPAPSLAITTKEAPLTGFGEISLVTDPEFLSSRGINMFNADVYSARYPNVSYKIAFPAFRKVYADIEAATAEPLREHLSSDLYEGDIKWKGMEPFKNAPAVQYIFLKEKGIDAEALFKYNEDGSHYFFGTKQVFRDTIREKNLEVELNRWVTSNYGHIVKKEYIARETRMGDTRWVPHTLDNVVKTISQKLRDNEGFNYGVPSIRANIAVRFKNVKHVQENRASIVSNADMTLLKDEADGEFWNLLNKYDSYLKIPGTETLSGQDFSEHLKEMIDRGVKRTWPEYYEGIPEELENETIQFFDKLRNMPTEYFEVKAARAVGLDEFKAALVPIGTSTDVLNILKKHGIEEIVFYDSKDPAGWIHARQSALEKLSGTRPDLFFQTDRPVGFYSGLVAAAGDMPQKKGGGAQMFNLLKKQAGVKAEEIEWSGLDEWFADRDIVTRDEIVEYLQNSKVRVTLARKGTAHKEKLAAMLNEYREASAQSDAAFKRLGFGVGQEEALMLLALEGSKRELRADFLETEEKIKLYNEFKVREDRAIELYNAYNDYETQSGAANQFDVANIGEGFQGRYQVEFVDGTITVVDLRALPTAERTDDRIIQVAQNQILERKQEDPKFEKYVFPGIKKNYREVLMTLARPEAEIAEHITIERSELGKFYVYDNKNEKKLTKVHDTKHEALLDAALKGHVKYHSDSTYSSPHWDENNILTHLRMNDRLDENDNRVLFIEEIQSDWHQEARERGYYDSGEIEAERQKLKEEYDTIEKELDKLGYRDALESFSEAVASNTVTEEYMRKRGVPNAIVDDYIFNNEITNEFAKRTADKYKFGPMLLMSYEHNKKEMFKMQAIIDKGKDLNFRQSKIEDERTALRNRRQRAVPNAPFKKTWPALAFKQALLIAVNEGYDKVAWTTGAMQADRYDLTKQADTIAWLYSEGDEKGKLVAYKDQYALVEKEIAESELPNFVGKELTNRILMSEAVFLRETPKGERRHRKQIKGDAMRVGGQAMISFYDNIVPSVVKKVVKKDAAVEDVSIKIKEDALETVQGIEVTEALKDRVSQGLPLFQADPDSSTRRGSVKFSDTQATINLFKAANMSTFLHETAHIFTMEMRSVIEAGKGTEQFKKDFTTLVEFAGGKLDVEGHEKIARAFEAYLREGKAPSVKLAEAFQRFREWLTAVYKSIRGLDVEITDEIRQVFDRLLSSEREILEAQEYYKAKDSLVELIPVNKKQRDKILKAKDKADKTALEIQTAKYMKAYLSVIGGRTVIRDQAIRDVEEMPVYKATTDIIATGGLTIDDIKNTYGDNAVNDLKEKNSKLVKAKGKTSLAEMAVKYNFESEQALLNALLIAEKKQAAISTRTQEILIEREEQIREELARQETVPGEESIHNDAQLAYLIAESEVLAERIAKAEKQQIRKLEAKIFKDAAEEIINKKTVRTATRYDLYAKAEQRHARAAYDALQKGDLIAAHEAKKKQILNHVLVQAAVRARDDKYKIENRYKTKRLLSKLKKTENAYADTALDLANSYRLTDKAPADPKLVSNIADLDELLADQTPQWILDKQKPDEFKDWRDLTMAQLRELDNTIQSVIHYGRDAFSALEDDKYKTVASLVEASMADMDQLKDKEVFDEFSIKGKFLNKVDGLLARAVMTEFLFERLDNYQFTKEGTFGPLRRLFNRGVQAETDFNEIKINTLDAAQGHWDTLYKASKRIEQLYGGKTFDLPGVPVLEAMKKLGRYKWTVERMIAFVLNLGNSHNREVIQRAYGYTDAQVDTIIKQFTTTELQAIQGIWNVTNTLFPALDKVHFNLYNRHLPKVEAVPLVANSADGQTVKLQGGYYPLMFDHMLSDKTAALKEEDLMKNRMSAVYRSTKPVDGMTYARKEGHSLPPDLSVGVWFSHIADTARNISHSEYMRDLNRVTSDPTWRAKVRDKAGRAAYNEIREWAKFQARAERRLTDPWDRLLENQRRLATISILGANLSVGTKQRLSMINAASEIGWKWIVEAYRDMDMKNSVLGLSNSEAWQKVLDQSPYMKARVKAIDRELTDARGKMDPLVKKFEIQGKEFVWKDVQDFMFEFIQMNDRATVGVVWQGSYNKYMAEVATKDMTDNQRQKGAVEYADAIVRNTQPSALPFDLNSLQRSEGVMRLFTSFMTWTFKFGNRFVGKTRAYKDGAITTREYARHVMYEGMLAPWGAMLITSFLVYGELPEWWEWLTAPAETAVSWIPILRDVPRAAKYRTVVGASPAFEGINRATKAGKTGWQWIQGDEEFMKLLWDIGRATEVQLGVPALKVTKDIKRTYDNITGNK